MSTNEPGGATVNEDRSQRPAGIGDEPLAPQDGTVPGDRGIPSVNRARSLQARISNALAIGLMSTLGIGLLTWYYTQSFARHSRAQAQAHSDAQEKAKGEMSLPALGRVDPPPTAPTVIERVLGPPPEPPMSEWSSAYAGMDDLHVGSRARAGEAGRGTAKAPEDVARERRLAGPAFVANAAASGRLGEGELVPAYETDPSRRLPGERPGTASGGLESLLSPAVTPAALANVLPTQRLLLAKGSFLDCTLETAIDSTLPGMTTCVLATDAFSADGSVVLLERGAKLVGETRGEMRQGAARIFVLWTEARTPQGVVVPLASPGADELGRSGLPGEVDRHFLERFGAAILISVIDGAIQAAVQSSRGGTTVVYDSSSSRDIMTEVLRSTVNIPPTVRKANGDRIQVLVARDLDFRTVYELSPLAREAGG